ncbi:ABC transporter substrate-binding protein [Rubrimonas sp.]|uniref:ABC transporter substrate-binding protein n=1 Tax=Rubrimonas sp. TaxID=2036015 RepID=UPI002FDD66AD
MFRPFIAAALALGVGAAQQAAARDVVRFAYLADPSHEAVTWAMRTGRVSSETIEVEAEALELGALIQSTAARTYDVVQTAAMAVPRARERGLDLRIVGTALRYHAEGEGADIWVPVDSDIQTAEDLRGKRLAVYSIGSAGVTLVRIALAKAHGMDVDLDSGDMEFIEMPPPGMPAALFSGRVDAATLIHAQAFEAQRTGTFRSVASTAVDNYEAFGVRMVSAVLAGYGDRLDAEPEKHREFLRLLRASVDYARENPDEVFAAVAEETGVEPAFFERWFAEFSDFPVLMTEDDAKAIEILWSEAQALGLLDSHPPVAETVWTETLTEAAVR